MYVIAWVVLGLAAGFLGGKFATQRGDRAVPYLVLGVVGAAMAGYAFGALSPAEPGGFIDIPSLAVSLVGAVSLLAAYHAYRGRHFRT